MHDWDPLVHFNDLTCKDLGKFLQGHTYVKVQTKHARQQNTVKMCVQKVETSTPAPMSPSYTWVSKAKHTRVNLW